MRILLAFLAFLFLVSVPTLLLLEKLNQDHNTICNLQNQINIMNEIIEDQEKELNDFRDHVKRMQMIAGVKNPDSVFTYKEKLAHPINTKNLIIR